MTHVLLPRLALAIVFCFASFAHAQATPEGYLALDKFGETTSPAEATALVFTAERGASLRATLEQWAQKAGWQPISWKLPEDTDFTLGAAGTFNGDFVTATRAFVNALGSEADLRVHFNQGNRLMVVEPAK